MKIHVFINDFQGFPEYEKLKGLWKTHLYKDHLFIQVTQNPIPRMTFSPLQRVHWSSMKKNSQWIARSRIISQHGITRANMVHDPWASRNTPQTYCSTWSMWHHSSILNLCLFALNISLQPSARKWDLWSLPLCNKNTPKASILLGCFRARACSEKRAMPCLIHCFFSRSFQIIFATHGFYSLFNSNHGIWFPCVGELSSSSYRFSFGENTPKFHRHITRTSHIFYKAIGKFKSVFSFKRCQHIIHLRGVFSRKTALEIISQQNPAHLRFRTFSFTFRLFLWIAKVVTGGLLGWTFLIWKTSACNNMSYS